MKEFPCFEHKLSVILPALQKNQKKTTVKNEVKLMQTIDYIGARMIN